jgi:hypothetical protein
MNMNNAEFSDAVEKLLTDPDLDPVVARQLLCAISVDTRSRTAVHLQELQAIIKVQSENIAALTTAVEALERHIDTHPTIIYLFRFRTKESIAVAITIILVLSLWYVSGFRQPILRWLGWPVF